MQLVMKHITHMLRFVVASRIKLNVVAGLGFCGFAVEKASTIAHRWHHSSWITTLFFTSISTSFDPRHPYPFSDIRKMQEERFEKYQLLVSLEVRLQIGYPDIRISGYPDIRHFFQSAD